MLELLITLLTLIIILLFISALVIVFKLFPDKLSSKQKKWWTILPPSFS